MPHRILTVNPETGTQGIYLEGEIAGLPDGKLWIDKAEFPAIGGGSEAQKIARLESNLAELLDSKIPATNSQRIRVKVFSLVPLEYVMSVFASPADITPNWWVG